ncbi:MAG: glycosyltransferase family 4 protein [Rhodothermales bacterium]
MARFSLFVADLSRNALARVVPVALALRERHEVEILGLFLADDEVYGPYADLFEYRAIRTSPNVTTLLASSRQLAVRATGDVMYAFKPVLSSFGPALYASRVPRRRPLLLDVDDDEWGTMGTTWAEKLRRDVLGGWRHGTAVKYTRALHPLTWLADGTTVVSRKLQHRYGGTLLRHPADLVAFDPTRPEFADVAALRRRFDLPADRPLALFAGVARAHKGLDVVAEALLRPECAGWDLILAGSPRTPEFDRVQQRLGDRCRQIGRVPFAEMPALLAAVDAVPVVQQPVAFAESQVPTKLIDAMAMAKPVVGTRVGDGAEIIGRGERGWLAEPQSAASVAAAFAEIAANVGEARTRGAAARAWVRAEASATVARIRIEALLADVDAPARSPI